MSKTNILVCCPLWGMDNLRLEDALDKIKSAGYDGVEMAIPSDKKERKQLKNLLDKNGLQVIASQFLAGGATPKEHLASFKALLKEYADFKPLFINSHTGKDFYSITTNAEFLQAAVQIENETGVRIVHETHRGRFSYSAPVTKSYMEAFPNLKLNADFSHWCCVSESLLEDQAECMNLAISKAYHVHARVGHPEGPQVSDPRAPEWASAVGAHFAWWDKIVEARKGEPYLTFTPEFGPVPYMQSLPYTQQPVASQWDVNVYMMGLLKKRYAG